MWKAAALLQNKSDTRWCFGRPTPWAEAAEASRPTKKNSMEILANGLRLSRVGEVLVERCIAGWKEIEYEVMRDSAGNVHYRLQYGKH